jgi:hypothetical protein
MPRGLLFSSIVPLEIWDTPGKEDVPEEEFIKLLGQVHAVVFMIDINVSRIRDVLGVLNIFLGPLVQCYHPVWRHAGFRNRNGSASFGFPCVCP